MAENTHLAKELNNINIETVENCNLLCKLVMDYVSTDKCTIEVVKDENNDDGTHEDNSGATEDIKAKSRAKRSFRIVYPPGSFINYRDTSYELTYAYFFYPSRHSIDGERYDLEVNIYHGNYRNGGDKKGMAAHTHYHVDAGNSAEDVSNQHKHFHYHLPSDEQNDVHKEDEKHNEKNIVTCLLYNMGKHTGSDVNIFFNQFIHYPGFKKLKIKQSPNNFDIKVHDNWSIEKIYPKKRSYFLYDGQKELTKTQPSGTEDKYIDRNTYVVFDTIQTISKEIIDRLYERGIKNSVKSDGNEGFDINGLASYDVQKLTNVFYRKNIEVITDEQYKKIKRAQINDLLSLTRMSTYKPVQRTTKEYNEISQGIVESISGGRNTGYLTNEDKAKRVAKHWEYYGKDKPIEKQIKDVDPTDAENIVFDDDNIKKYDYINIIYDYFKNDTPEGKTFDRDIDPATKDYKLPFETYIKQKTALYNAISVYMNWKEDDNEARLVIVRNKTLFDIIGALPAFKGELAALVHSSCRDTKSDDDVAPICKKMYLNGLLDYYDNTKLYKYNESKHAKLVSMIEYFTKAEPLINEITNQNKIRFFFEEIDLNWKKKHNIDVNVLPVINVDKKIATITETLTLIKKIPELAKKLIVAVADDDLIMNRTLSNEECQEWLSNETHYEGSLWKFWEKPVTLSKNQKYDFNNLPISNRKKIGEGMLKYEDPDGAIKWKTHNECRNPGNRSAAPWCYTKNPNKRWEYCSKPVYSDILGKIVLFLIFIFLGVVAFLTIKTFFLHEYPMAWVAKLTGGTFASKDTFAGKAGTGAPKPARSTGPPKTK
jgi:hypothetical protein